MRRGIKIGKVVIMIVVALFVVGFIRQEITMNRLSDQISEKHKQLEELESKNERLQDEVNQCNTDEYIERLARERLGMIKQGEKVIINKDKSK